MQGAAPHSLGNCNCSLGTVGYGQAIVDAFGLETCCDVCDVCDVWWDESLDDEACTIIRRSRGLPRGGEAFWNGGIWRDHVICCCVRDRGPCCLSPACSTATSEYDGTCCDIAATSTAAGSLPTREVMTNFGSSSLPDTFIVTLRATLRRAYLAEQTAG